MELSQAVNVLDWPVQHTMSEDEECIAILNDIFGSVHEAMIDPVMIDFLDEVGLAADWDANHNEIVELVVQCEDELYAAWREANGIQIAEESEEEESEEEESEEEESYTYGGGNPVSEPPMF